MGGYDIPDCNIHTKTQLNVNLQRWLTDVDEGAGGDELLAISKKVLSTVGVKLGELTSLSEEEVAARDILTGVRLQLVARLNELHTNAMV